MAVKFKYNRVLALCRLVKFETVNDLRTIYKMESTGLTY